MKSNTQLTVSENGEFDVIRFLGDIEKQKTLQKKVAIMNKVLNQVPIRKKNLKEEMIRKGLNAGNAQDFDYVPIEAVEEALRQIFFRQVDFEIKTSYRDLNSFIVVATVKYLDPITSQMRTIDGIGAKAIQQDKGATIDFFNSTMKANGLELAVGIAYSRAIKNAAKKLGKMFGANLNRDEEIDDIVVFKNAVTRDSDDKEAILNTLFNELKDLIPDEDLPHIERIIERKETCDYDKAIDSLKTLKTKENGTV